MSHAIIARSLLVARTRPMTGSATKQSIGPRMRRDGLLRFARNDAGGWHLGKVSRSRDMNCPSFACRFAALKAGCAGKAECRSHPRRHWAPKKIREVELSCPRAPLRLAYQSLEDCICALSGIRTAVCCIAVDAQGGSPRRSPPRIAASRSSLKNRMKTRHLTQRKPEAPSLTIGALHEMQFMRAAMRKHPIGSKIRASLRRRNRLNLLGVGEPG